MFEKLLPYNLFEKKKAYKMFEKIVINSTKRK